MSTFEERLAVALDKFDLKEEVQKIIMRQCKLEGLDSLAGISPSQLERYVEQIILAAWLDSQYEVADMELNRNEKKSELMERAMTDVTKLLRLIAINKLK
ncbi:hypothetical protein [Vibrio harveyi]|uniref:hypothetical protein n=1 Tax=Vibrio harveyi TaxID=669 RepID=UPI0005EEFEBF|nr:hypothetical protein [Vibrio harveyi]QFQ76117.1 hypothetical protein F9277_00870 [Vibrio harveyi]